MVHFCDWCKICAWIIFRIWVWVVLVHLLKRLSLHHLMPFAPYQRSAGICVGFMWVYFWDSVLLMSFIYLFFSNFTQSWLFCLISLFLPSLPLLLDSWGGVDLELGASWMLGKCSTTEQNPQPLVVLKDVKSLLPPFVSVSVRFLNIYKITCCHLDWVALNLLIVLWWADILTVLTLPVHEYGICLCNSLNMVHVVS